jgi:hypothetical protein
MAKKSFRRGKESFGKEGKENFSKQYQLTKNMEPWCVWFEEK